MLSACSGVRESYISEVADLPVKSTELPNMSWQSSPLRANVQYVFHTANSGREKALRVGDYYYVSWYDAEPEKPAKLVMHYTQAATGAKVHTREQELPAGRASRGKRKTPFFFAGEERRKLGDVMSWRIDLYSGGELRDSEQSYLWE